jgi:SAM-dependent methyltransferase
MIIWKVCSEGYLRILELNAGTGIDAVELAKRGYFIHATDIVRYVGAPPEKSIQSLGDRITSRIVPILLAEIQGAPYDAIFSDLGGLNCIPDLRPIIQQLPMVLKPGGLLTWVLMPRPCLWELAEIFRGHPRLAVRRFARGGTRTHLEGYISPPIISPRRVMNCLTGYNAWRSRIFRHNPYGEAKFSGSILVSIASWLIDDRIPKIPLARLGRFLYPEHASACMSFPNYHNKVQLKALYGPRDIVDYRKRIGRMPDLEAPDGILFCLERGLPWRLRWRIPVRRAGGMNGDLYSLKRSQGRVGIMTGFGGGSPMTVELAEEFAQWASGA